MAQHNRHAQPKGKNALKRLKDPRRHWGKVVVFYVFKQSLEQINRTGGGLFKVIQERLGKQYKCFILPCAKGDKERMEIWYHGKAINKMEKDIYSASNVTFEAVLSTMNQFI